LISEHNLSPEQLQLVVAAKTYPGGCGEVDDDRLSQAWLRASALERTEGAPVDGDTTLPLTPLRPPSILWPKAGWARSRGKTRATLQATIVVTLSLLLVVLKGVRKELGRELR